MVRRGGEPAQGGLRRYFQTSKGWLKPTELWAAPQEQALSGPCGLVCPDMQVTKTAEGSRYPPAKKPSKSSDLGPNIIPTKTRGQKTWSFNHCLNS